METITSPYYIYYEPTLDCVIMEWKGYATSPQFRQGTEMMLEALVQNHATRVLADIKDMVIIGTQDQQWLDSEFLPKAIKSGFNTLAIVKPVHYFNKVAVESISYKVDKDKLAINFFEDIDEAKEWLEKSN